MSEKHWYQDGWLVLVIVAVAGFLTMSYWHNNQKAAFEASLVVPQLDLKFRQALLGPPTLDCLIWHQRPENLQNIMVTLFVSTDNKDWEDQTRSLVMWEPNREHAVSFSFPLAKSYVDNTVYIKLAIGGAIGGPKRKLYFVRMKWKDGHWSAMSMEPPPPNHSP